MEKLEIVFMAVFWNQILNQFKKVSEFLQSIELDLVTASNMLNSLTEYVKNMRDEYLTSENEAKNINDIVESNYSDVKKRKITKKVSNNENVAQLLNGSDKFRIETLTLS